jgi:integrase
VAPSEKVSDIWKAYVADRRRDGKSIDPTGSTWKALAPSFGYKIGSAITVEDCREHYKKRKALGRTDSTIKTELDLLRHTAGVWMAEADIPMQKISQYLGHTSTRVTESVYARYSPSFMKDAAEALDW